jgi:hypothetical protein
MENERAVPYETDPTTTEIESAAVEPIVDPGNVPIVVEETVPVVSTLKPIVVPEAKATIVVEKEANTFEEPRTYSTDWIRLPNLEVNKREEVQPYVVGNKKRTVLEEINSVTLDHQLPTMNNETEPLILSEEKRNIFSEKRNASEDDTKITATGEPQSFSNEEYAADEEINPFNIVQETPTFVEENPIIFPHKEGSIFDNVKPLIMEHNLPTFDKDIQYIVVTDRAPIAVEEMNGVNKGVQFDESEEFSNQDTVITENIKPITIFEKTPLIIEEINPLPINEKAEVALFPARSTTVEHGTSALIEEIKPTIVDDKESVSVEAIQPAFEDEHKAAFLEQVKPYDEEQTPAEMINPLTMSEEGKYTIEFPEPFYTPEQNSKFLEEINPLTSDKNIPILVQETNPIFVTDKRPNVVGETKTDDSEEIKMYIKENRLVEEKAKPITVTEKRETVVEQTEPTNLPETGIGIQEIKPIEIDNKFSPVKDIKPITGPVGERMKPVSAGESKENVFQEVKTYSKENVVVEEKIKPLTVIDNKQTVLDQLRPTDLLRKGKVFENIKPINVDNIISNANDIKPTIGPVGEAVKPVSGGENIENIFEELKTHSKENAVVEEKVTPVTVFENNETGSDPLRPTDLQETVKAFEAIKPTYINHNINALFDIKPINGFVTQRVKPVSAGESKENVLEEVRTYTKENVVVNEKRKHVAAVKNKETIDELRPMNLKETGKAVEEIKPIKIDNKFNSVKDIKTITVPVGERAKPDITGGNKQNVIEEVKTYSKENIAVEGNIKPTTVIGNKQSVVDQLRPNDLARTDKVAEKFKPINVDKYTGTVKDIKPIIGQVMEKVKPVSADDSKGNVFEEVKTYTKENAVIEEATKPVTVIDNRRTVVEQLRPFDLIRTGKILENIKPISVDDKTRAVKDIKPITGKVMEKVEPVSAGESKENVFEEVKTYSKENVGVEEKIKPLTVIDNKQTVVDQLRPTDVIRTDKVVENIKPINGDKIGAVKDIKPVTGKVVEKMKPISADENKENIFEEVKTHSKENVFIEEKIKPITAIDKKQTVVEQLRPTDLIGTGKIFENIKPINVYNIIRTVKDIKPTIGPVGEAVKPVSGGENIENIFEELKTHSKENAVVEEKVTPVTVFENNETGSDPLRPTDLQEAVKGVEAIKPTYINHNINALFDIKPITGLVTEKVKPVSAGESKENVFEGVKTHSKENVFIEEKIKPITVIDNRQTIVKQLRPSDIRMGKAFENFEPINVNNMINTVKDIKPTIRPVGEIVKPVSAGENRENVSEEVQMHNKANVVTDERIKPVIVFEDKETDVDQLRPFDILGTSKVTENIKPTNVDNKIGAVKGNKPIIGQVIEKEKPVSTGESKENVFQEVKTYSKENDIEEKIEPITLIENKETVHPLRPTDVPETGKLVQSDPIKIAKKLHVIKENNPFIWTATTPTFFKEVIPIIVGGNKGNIVEEVKTYSKDNSVVESKVKPISVSEKSKAVVEKTKPIHLTKNGAFVEEIKSLNVDDKLPVFREIKPNTGTVTIPFTVEDAHPVTVDKTKADILEELRTYSKDNIVIQEKFDPASIIQKQTTVAEETKPAGTIEKKGIKAEQLTPFSVENKVHTLKEIRLNSAVPTNTIKLKGVTPITVGETKADVFEEFKTYNKDKVVVEENITPLIITEGNPTVIEQIKVGVEPDRKSIIAEETKPLIVDHGIPTSREIKPIPVTDTTTILTEVKPVPTGEIKSDVSEELKTYSKENVVVKEKFKPVTITENKSAATQDVRPTDTPEKKVTFVKGTKPIIVEQEGQFSKEITPIFGDDVKPTIIQEEKSINIGENIANIFQQIKSLTNENAALQKNVEPNTKAEKVPIIEDIKRIIIPENESIVKGVSPMIEDKRLPISKETKPILIGRKGPSGVEEFKIVPLGENKPTVSEKLKTYSNERALTEGEVKPINVVDQPVVVQKLDANALPNGKGLSVGKMKSVNNNISILKKRSESITVAEKKPVAIEEAKPINIAENQSKIYNEVETYSDIKAVVEDKIKPLIIADDKPVLVEETKPNFVSLKKGAPIEKLRPVTGHQITPVLIKETKPDFTTDKKPTVLEEITSFNVGRSKANITEELETYSNTQIVIEEKTTPLSGTEKKPVVVVEEKPFTVREKSRIPVGEMEATITDHKAPIATEETKPPFVVGKKLIVVQKNKPTTVGDNRVNIFDELKSYSNENIVTEEKIKSFSPSENKHGVVENTKPSGLAGKIRKSGEYIKTFIEGHKIPLSSSEKDGAFAEKSKTIVSPEKKNANFGEVKYFFSDDKSPIFTEELKLHTKAGKRQTVREETKPFTVDENKATILEDLKTSSNKEKVVEEVKRISEAEKNPLLFEELNPITVPDKRGKVIEGISPIFAEQISPIIVEEIKPILVADKRPTLSEELAPLSAGENKGNIFEELKSRSNIRTNIEEKINPFSMPEETSIADENLKPFTEPQERGIVFEEIKPVTEDDKMPSFIEERNPLITNDEKYADFEELESFASGNKNGILLEKTKRVGLGDKKKTFIEHLKPFLLRHGSIKPILLNVRKFFIPDKKVAVVQVPKVFNEDLNEFDVGSTHIFYDGVMPYRIGSERYYDHGKSKEHTVEETRRAIGSRAVPVDVPNSYHVGDRKTTLVQNKEYYDAGNKGDIVIEGTKTRRVPDIKDILFGDVKSFNEGQFQGNRNYYNVGNINEYPTEDIKSYRRQNSYRKENEQYLDHFPDFQDKKVGADRIKDYVYGVKDYSVTGSEPSDSGTGREYGLGDQASLIERNDDGIEGVRSYNFDSNNYRDYNDRNGASKEYTFDQKKDYAYGLEKDFGFGTDLKNGKEKSYSYDKKSKHGYDSKEVNSFIFGDKYRYKKELDMKDLKSFEFDDKGERVTEKTGFSAGKALDIERGIGKYKSHSNRFRNKEY